MTAYTKIVNKHLQASIKPISPEVDLEKNPMFAINWLDLKIKWMYNVYTYLAFPMARSIGAKAIFKGYQQQLLVDTANLDRKVLLLVRYPGPRKFLSLLGRKLFQLISLLRIKSVSNFNLGFAHLLEGHPCDREMAYLVYHFQGGSTQGLLENVKSLCAQSNSQLFYSGLKVASLCLIQNGREREVPLPIDGLFILANPKQEALISLTDTHRWKELMEGRRSNYLGLFQRVI